MPEYETEEQQLEALKKWWKENATSLILGVSIGAMGLGGWTYYTGSKNDHRLEASDLYVSVAMQSQDNSLGDEYVQKANQLITNYADTPYAALSALTLASKEFNSGNKDKAIEHLKWAADNAKDEEVQHTARLRMVSILISQNKYDDALTLLSSEHPAAFNARYEELKGDVFVAKNQIEQARVAYDKAIDQSTTSSRWLKLKRQDLGSSELKKPSTVEPAA
jgi:predicted negative regulator of RcsB-dependent stress response